MGSSWHIANTKILSPYSAFSKELLSAELGAYIGLTHVNITLLGEQHWKQRYLQTRLKFCINENANQIFVVILFFSL